jgi:glycosyltransferase involved in cell wall biosynthesis
VTPRVTLLIPNRNNEPALDLVFERLAEHTSHPDVEIVVVDDGSDDRSREILRRWRDSGRFARFVLHEQPPSGVVVALNKGLELATGDVVVQLDADATVETPGWLEKMLPLLDDERTGVVSPRVVFDSGYVHAYGVNIVCPEGLHDGTTRITEPVGQRTLHQNVERVRERDAPVPAEPVEVDSGIGCCMMYRRADALAVGGYDMGFQPVWFDDLDLALSIRHKLAKRNLFHPEVHVIHRVGMRATRPDARASVRERAEAAVGRLLSARVKRRIAERTGRGGASPEHLERLRHHYAYWREKWGWDLLNPDMDEVRRRYAGSQLLWRDA